jgi:hypothetical protein
MSPRPRAPRNLSLRKFAPIFAALGDEMRLRLIAVLCAGSAMSITQLTSGTDISRQAITKHPAKRGERLFGASIAGKLLYNPRALPIRFAGDPSVGLKDYDWRCKLLIYKAPVAQPDRAPAF